MKGAVILKYYYSVTHGCTLCNTCTSDGPAGAITLERDGAHINEKLCVGCGNCYDNCASEAIERRERTDIND